MSQLALSSHATESTRSVALVSAVGLAAMVVAAPLGIFVALPAGFTGVSALVVLTIAVLDVVVGVSLSMVFADGGALLARVSASLRIAYGAGFAVAGGALLAPADVGLFHRIWDAALCVFSAHLFTLGMLMWRSGRVPRWIAALIGLAGAGYFTDAILAALAPSMGFSVAAVTFAGELVLIVWLLARGGRTPNTPHP